MDVANQKGYSQADTRFTTTTASLQPETGFTSAQQKKFPAISCVELIDSFLHNRTRLFLYSKLQKGVTTMSKKNPLESPTISTLVNPCPLCGIGDTVWMVTPFLGPEQHSVTIMWCASGHITISGQTSKGKWDFDLLADLKDGPLASKWTRVRHDDD